MLVVGIDPDTNGTAALMNQNAVDPLLDFMSFAEMTMPQVVDKLVAWDLFYTIDAVYIEMYGARAGDGRASLAKYLKFAGAIDGAVRALGLKVVMVYSQTWQLHHDLGGIAPNKRKKAHKEKADSFNLGVDLTQKTADGILICKFGLDAEMGNAKQKEMDKLLLGGGFNAERCGGPAWKS